jgi:predicted RNA binding protein YcfA (HicA-like mRNA interferase family)
MGKWRPFKRRDFIRKLRKFGFQRPEPGGNHYYMRYGTYTLTLPSNNEYSISQLKMLLKEIESGIDRKLSLDEWEQL